jgi:hypothetical protein
MIANINHIESPVNKGAYRKRLSTTWLLPMAYITKHSHSIVLFPSWEGGQGIHVRISIVQLGFIELLCVNAQPLHNVKTIKRSPRRRIMQSVLTFAQQRKKFSHELLKCWPQSSGWNILAQRHNHPIAGCNVWFKERLRLKGSYFLNLLLKWGWKVTRLGLLTIRLKWKA